MREKWRKFDIVWLSLAIVIVLFSIIYKHIAILDKLTPVVIASDVAAVLGAIYVVLTIKQTRKAYLFGIGNVILYAFAVYNNGLYISAGYNLLYSFPVMVYGYIHWKKLEETQNDDVKRLSFKARIFGVCLMLGAVIGLAFVSDKFFSGTNVWMDSIVSVCTCVATFLLTQKYIEQWILFIVADFMGVILFFPKGVNDIGNINLFFMWCVYFVNSIYGYAMWRKCLVKTKDKI